MLRIKIKELDAWQCPAVGWACCYLANATCLLTPVLWTMAGGWVRTSVLFLAVCGPKYTILMCLCGSDRSLRCIFLIDDFLFDVFGPPNFVGKGHPNFWPNFYRTMHVVLARYCYRKSSVRPSACPSVRLWRWCTQWRRSWGFSGVCWPHTFESGGLLYDFHFHFCWNRCEWQLKNMFFFQRKCFYCWRPFLNSCLVLFTGYRQKTSEFQIHAQGQGLTSQLWILDI